MRSSRGTRLEWLQTNHQGGRECFGAIGKDVAAGLTIRHKNDAQNVSRDFQAARPRTHIDATDRPVAYYLP